MARNMSFSLTTEQVRNRTKTVTRRLGWDFLKRGDVLNACVKCQGLSKGGKVERICQIRVVSVDSMPLNYLSRATVVLYQGPYITTWQRDEVVREGFPELTPAEFVTMFCAHMKCRPSTIVNRIEFEYI